jgi:hypothetical protein
MYQADQEKRDAQDNRPEISATAQSSGAANLLAIIVFHVILLIGIDLPGRFLV